MLACLLAGEYISAHSEVAEQVQIGSVHKATRNEVGGVVAAGLAAELVVPTSRAYASADEHLQDLRHCD